MAFLRKKATPPLARRVLDRAKPAALIVVGGAALAYVFDPQQGKGRRAKIRDVALGSARSAARQAGRLGRKVGSDAYGIAQRVRHRTTADPYPDDPTLAQKVRSEILGWGGDFSATTIIVNVENGVVDLRGTVDRPDLVDKLETEVRRLPGVVDVRNNVHIEGSEATTKTLSIEASRGGIGPRV